MTDVRFHTRVLRNLADIDAARDDWATLENASSGRMVWFQSFDWCRTWIAIHGGKDFVPHVIVLLDGTRVCAIWPLMIARGPGGLRILTSLGEPHTQYANILSSEPTLSRTEADCLLATALQTKGVDALIANFVPEFSPLISVMPEASEIKELRNSTSQLHLAEFAASPEYGETGKKSKKAWQRSEKVLREFGKISMEVQRPGHPEYADLVRKAVVEKENWVKRTGRISAGLRMGDHAVFLSAVPIAADGIDGPLLFVMKAGTLPFAFEVGFIQHGHYYRYLGSFDWTYRDASPGKVQIDSTIAWLVENEGKVFDLMGNPTDYKKRLSNVELELRSFSIPLTLKGRAYTQMWVRFIRPRLKSAYHWAREFKNSIGRPPQTKKSD